MVLSIRIATPRLLAVNYQLPLSRDWETPTLLLERTSNLVSVDELTGRAARVQCVVADLRGERRAEHRGGLRYWRPRVR
jgi:hypothetical protein